MAFMVQILKSNVCHSILNFILFRGIISKIGNAQVSANKYYNLKIIIYSVFALYL